MLRNKTCERNIEISQGLARPKSLANGSEAIKHPNCCLFLRFFLDDRLGTWLGVVVGACLSLEAMMEAARMVFPSGFTHAVGICHWRSVPLWSFSLFHFKKKIWRKCPNPTQNQTNCWCCLVFLIQFSFFVIFFFQCAAKGGRQKGIGHFFLFRSPFGNPFSSLFQRFRSRFCQSPFASPPFAAEWFLFLTCFALSFSFHFLRFFSEGRLGLPTWLAGVMRLHTVLFFLSLSFN